MGNFVSVLIEKGDVEDLLQLLVGVVADIGVRPVWLQERIALFPNTDGMGLDPR
jgi:hypothetical protein